MPLEPGSKLGGYEIISVIGAGGMGEVYRARDPKLGRDIAVKVLPPDVADNNERRTRFEREAKVVASLNHPNIVTVFSIEGAEGVPFITMELVKGKTLRELLPKQGFKLRQFYDIATQLADAVGAAHREGVTHRDIKPDNVMIDDDGRVRVLDFGLARPDGALDIDSETVTQARTNEGAIVGTIAYMSPEQAQGGPVDSRSDIFSLGAVYYEMLTGCRPFQGDSAASTLAAILNEEPRTASEMRPDISRDLGRIVRRCLTKDLTLRFQTARDVHSELIYSRDDDVDLSAPRTAERRAGGGRVAAWGAAAVVPLAFAVGYLSRGSDAAPAVPAVFNPRQLTSAPGAENFPALSSDGERVAFHAGEAGREDVWVAQVGTGVPVNRTDDTEWSDRFPSWSPDGSTIAFVSNRGGGGVYAVPAVGGAPRRVFAIPGLDVVASPRRPMWSRDGTRIAMVHGLGNDLTLTVFTIDSQDLTEQPFDYKRCDGPRWSPDGRFVACIDGGNGSQFADLWLLPLAGGEPIEVARNARDPVWSSGGDRLFFLMSLGNASDVWQQALSSGGSPRGDPAPVTTGLRIQRWDISLSGRRLAYATRENISNVWRAPTLRQRTAHWTDAEQLTFDGSSSWPAISADGRMAIRSRRSGVPNLWVQSRDRGELTQLTMGPSNDVSPAWSPDGAFIAFTSDRAGNPDIWVMPSEGGAARAITTNEATESSAHWSPDGQEIVFASRRGGVTDLWIAGASGGAPRRLTSDPAVDQMPRWSPDGEWVAFQSLRGGLRRHWRVRRTGGTAVPINDSGNGYGVWSRDGRELFYDCYDRRMLCASDIESGQERVLVDLTAKRGRLLNGRDVDRTHIYFGWYQEEGSIWVMDVVRE